MADIPVYLAGPEVFLADARAIGEAKRAICARHGLLGRFPLDNGSAPPRADEIYAGNVAMMRTCRAIVANLTPFRSPSADPGTAFELGFMLGLGLPVFGYTNRPGTLKERVRPDGLAVEDFGHFDNLMLAEALAATGGVIRPPRPPVDPDRDLRAFSQCIAKAAEHLRRAAA